MDRHAPDALLETPEQSYADTRADCALARARTSQLCADATLCANLKPRAA